MGFDRTTGTLFYLNGLGFVGGVLLLSIRYWRREFYLVATGYALATVVAFFVMGGRVNELTILAKVAEAVVALVAAYLCVSEALRRAAARSRLPTCGDGPPAAAVCRPFDTVHPYLNMDLGLSNIVLIRNKLDFSPPTIDCI